MLITNILLVGWLLAVGGDRLWQRPRATTTGTDEDVIGISVGAILLRQVPLRPDRSLGPVGHTDALEQPTAMRLDRLFADAERGGDLLVLTTVDDQPQHLEFTACQLGRRCVQLPAATQEMSRHRWAQRRPPSRTERMPATRTSGSTSLTRYP